MDDRVRAAIVAGGAGGIGGAICERLGGCGYRVCVADQDGRAARSTARRMGEGHDWFGGDLTDPGQVAELVDQVTARATLTVLVNSAGISPKKDGGKKMFHEIDAEEWNRVMAVNLLAPFLLVREAHRHMPTDGSASIVNITSITARMAGGGPPDSTFPPYVPSGVHYGASKAGLHNLTASLARELAGLNIRCNAVAPGFISSTMTDATPDDYRRRVVGQIPAGRPGRPGEVADAVAFLVSEQARYVTGATLDVNGGWLPA